MQQIDKFSAGIARRAVPLRQLNFLFTLFLQLSHLARTDGPILTTRMSQAVFPRKEVPYKNHVDSALSFRGQIHRTPTLMARLGILKPNLQNF